MNNRQTWRTYQRTLKKSVKARRHARWIARYSPIFPFILAGVFSLFFAFSGSACRTGHGEPAVQVEKEAVAPEPYRYTKNDIRKIFTAESFANLKEKEFKFSLADKILNVKTSLDMPLQNHFLEQIENAKRMNRGQPRHLGIVALDPVTGRVLAMASFDKIHPDQNHCISSEFPAASLIKIITASAAVETAGLTPNSTLKYNGRKYTLYRSQLKVRNNKYTHRVTLKQSFAQSINPIFGKLGTHTLKKDLLQEYADAFYFNHDINFELPVSQSSFAATDSPYEWAELASGFNRKTQISPLHSALLTSIILNDGKMVEPTIIDHITDEEGHTLYQNDVKLLESSLSETTTEAVKTMMAATIRSGTARKAFRGMKRDSILSKLFIGGKTGSISNHENSLKYDWFAGFAEEKNGGRKIAVAVIVAHEKYLGPRACNYAKRAMKAYFKNVYAQAAEHKNNFKS